MIASKILATILVASICSGAFAAGIYRPDTKGGPAREQTKSGYSSPAQWARGSSELSKAEPAKQAPLEQKPLERIEQIRQEPVSQLKEEAHLEQVQLKQEEYREELPLQAPFKSLAAPAAKAPERKAPAQAPAPLAAPAPAPIKAPSKFEGQRKEEYRPEQKLETYEQKRETLTQQRHDLDSEQQVYAASRYEEQQQVQLEQAEQVREQYAEVKGARKISQAPISFAGVEQVRQEELAQAPLGEPEPYQFSYQVDGSSRTEQGDNKGVVRGQYTLQGADGASRVVDYVADHNGFRATVNTNEFGTESKSPASINLRTSQPSAEEITIKMDAAKTLRRAEAAAKGGQQARREEPFYAAKGVTYVQAPAQEQLRETAYESAPAKGRDAVKLRAPQVAPVEVAVAGAEEELRSAELIEQAPLAAPVRSENKSRRFFESATAHHR